MKQIRAKEARTKYFVLISLVTDYYREVYRFANEPEEANYPSGLIGILGDFDWMVADVAPARRRL